MNYELNCLGSQEFEKMIQSLVKGIEPSVKIYGSGPDGQRDFACDNANFEITIGKKILGYTVGQIKFKDPNGKEEDWNWLRCNLKSELDGFRKRKESGSNSESIPDTYLFFTNVVLTPKERTGLRDKAEDFVKEYSDVIPNIQLFGADDIRRMLDNNSDVRTRYAGFISSGDVLSEAYRQFQDKESTHVRKTAERIGRAIRDNSIRRLSEDLWINWKTGVLAADFRSALAGEEGSGRDAAPRRIFDFKKKGKGHLLRLLSILVQAEGGFVSWEELDARMPLILEEMAEGEGSRGSAYASAHTDPEPDIASDEPTGEGIASDGPAGEGIASDEAAGEDAGGDTEEGAEREAAGSEMTPDDAEEDDSWTVAEELRYYQSILPNTLKQYQGKTDERSLVLASNLRYINSWIKAIISGRVSPGENEEFSKTIVEKIRENDLLEAPRRSDRRRLRSLLGQLCRVSDRLQRIVRQDRTKGCRIEPAGLGIGQADLGRDLYADYYGYASEDGAWGQEKDWDNIAKYSSPGASQYSLYVQAWQRRYYNRICRVFEENVSNIRDAGGTEKDDGKGQDNIYGNYKMARIYMNAYASPGEKAGTGPLSGVEAQPGTEVMLDYLERWFRKDSSEEKVLVLHGQPGDGKTTFCKKAVYAYCKEGWLADCASDVFYFDLNPAKSNVVKEGLNLTELLFIEDQSSRKKTFLRPADLDGALVILDGFDELMSALSKKTARSTFEAFCQEVIKFSTSDLYSFKTVISSRTMCIADELKGRFFKAIPVVSFAPMTETRQDAMLERMIQLDREAESVAGDGLAGSAAGQVALKKTSLEDYKKVIEKIREKNSDGKYKYDKLNELLRNPSLFRMIVAQRFDDYEDTHTAADLYKNLFRSILKNRTGSVDEESLTRKYGNIAARIFSYSDDICPYDSEEMDDKELVYSFFTKDKQTGGRLGFLHRSFYQYFLAEFILSAIKNTRSSGRNSQAARSRGGHGSNLQEERALSAGTELVTDMGNLDAFPDIIDLAAVLRARRIEDPDMWKLLRNLAQNENEELAISGTSKNKNKIRRVLEWLDDRDNHSRLLGFTKDAEEEDEEDAKYEKDGFSASENAVFNLSGILACVEQGCRASTGRDGEGISYQEYPNVCWLLRHGDFSKIYLSGINLRGCDMRNARLRGSNLAGTTLENAGLEGADLSDANLTNAALTSANPPREAEGEAVAHTGKEHEDSGDGENGQKNDTKPAVAAAPARVYLTGAKLVGADLSGADLRGADLRNVVLADARLYGVRLEDADLSDADLSGSHFGHAGQEGDLEAEGGGEADAGGLSRRQAHLERAKLSGADLGNAHMEGAILFAADLRRACLRKAHFDGAQLDGACLEEADMTGISLCGSRLTKTRLAGAFMEGVTFDGNTRLDGADMSYAVFAGKSKEGGDHPKETNLQDVSLKWARLHCAFLSCDQYELLEKNNQDFAKVIDLPRLSYGGTLTVFDENSDTKGILSGIASGCRRRTEQTIDMRLKKGIIEKPVIFGCYPWGSDDRPGDKTAGKPLLWRVLRREYDKVLLITEELIDCQVYNKDFVDVTWEKSSLRSWLNGKFLLNAFTEEERARIAWVCNQNPDNDYFDDCFDDAFEGGNPTWDRVFALSIDEALRYFEDSADRRAPVTPYAEANGSYISNNYKSKERGTGWWWLRSPGIYSSNAAFVYSDGAACDYVSGVDNFSVSVRPALWLHL